MKTYPSPSRLLTQLLALLPAVCASSAAAQNGVPRPDHVIIVIEENHAYSSIIKSSGPSYMNSLARKGALFASSFAISHPSEPNYLALFSGSTHGVNADICSGAYGTPNLASELLSAGLSFVGYSESMPHAGFTGCESGHYKRKHNPWVNFTNIPPQLNAPLTFFPSNFNDLPTLSFVIPNQADDMHSGSVGQADDWLRRHLDRYVQWAATNNSLFILTWDEDDKSDNNHIATIFVGPMVRPGKYCERLTHFNVLRTLLEMYNLPPIAHATNADPITSCWMPGTAPSAVSLNLDTPRNGDVFLSRSNIVISGDAGSSNASIRRVEFFQSTIKLGETTNSPFQFVWSNATPGLHCVLAKATDDAGRTKTTASIQVRVLPPDSSPPSVTILQPVNGSRVLTPVIDLRASSTDNVGVVAMAFRVGSAPFQLVNSTNSLSTQIELAPGNNSIDVRSFDFYGNQSPLASVKVFLVTTSSLTVAVAGAGTVSPDLNGHALEVGRGYVLTARPAPGNLFAGWSGGLTNLSPRLNFLMQSNLFLQASFVTNPFLPVRGNYAGLFYEPGQVRHESSGYFSMTLSDRGSFSARLISAGKRFSFGGLFNLAGLATNTLRRPGTNDLIVQLQIDLDRISQPLTGLVYSASWQAALVADRNPFDARLNPSPFATNYTAVVRGSSNSPEFPGGDGAGVIRVSPAGTVTFSGTLADGSRLSENSTLSSDGLWPLYAPLYGGKGSVLGWISFADRPSTDLTGAMSWSKPPSIPGRLYPNGFQFDTALEGSIYTRPPLAPPLNQTNGTVSFSGDGLSAPFANAVSLASNGGVANHGSNQLSLQITAAQGLFHGSVSPPGTASKLSFQGALLQKQNSGSGFFPGTNQSGRVSWQKAD